MIAQQTEIPGAIERRTIITRAGYEIQFPPPVARGEPVFPQGYALHVVKRNIGRILSAGYPAIDPLTGKTIEVYRRGLHANQVHMLRGLDRAHRRHPRDRWIHLRDFCGRRDGDFSKMAHWGLIEERPAEQRLEGEAPRGWWAITDLGRRWLRGQATVPRQVCLLEGELLGFVDERDQITVDQVDDDFDVARLRAGGDGTQHAA